MPCFVDTYVRPVPFYTEIEEEKIGGMMEGENRSRGGRGNCNWDVKLIK